MSTKKKMIGMAVVFVLLAALVFWQEQKNDTARWGYLLREDVGGASYEKDLVAENGDGKEAVRITVEARQRTETERKAILTAAEEGVFSEVLQGMDPAHVDDDLLFPATLSDLPISLSFVTDAPQFVDWDGKLTAEIPEEGTKVNISATLSLDGEIREVKKEITVFPKVVAKEEAYAQAVQREVEEANSRDEEKLTLPQEVEGEAVTWKSKQGFTALYLLFCGAVFLFVYRFVEKDRIRQAKMKRMQEMRLDYPEITSQLALYLGAGLPLRMALLAMTDEERLRRKQGARARPGFQALADVCLAMQRGISEEAAYRNFGETVELVQYRTLASLFLQQLRFGSTEMAARLKEEAEHALTDRKKEAKVRGEQAGTKLLFPMLLLFADLLLVLLIPAFFSMQG